MNWSPCGNRLRRLNQVRRIASPFVFWIAAILVTGLCSAVPDEPPKLEIPLDVPSETVTAARKSVTTSLASIRPKDQARPSHFVTMDGRYVLFGELFGNGESYALVEITIPSEDQPQWNNGLVGFAQYSAGGWQLRALWNIPAVWRPKGWKESENDYLAIKPAEHPFELQDLSGDGVPEVIVAGEVNKYFQEHYSLRFDAKTKNLQFVAAAMGKPRFVGGFVRLDFNSGRRAIWAGSEFHQWEGAKLIQKASWHDEVPYNGPESPFVLATRFHSNGKKTEYRMEDALSDSETVSVYKITQDEKPFARVTFKWMKPFVSHEISGTNPDSSEKAYLFEKLTGLSRNLYPDKNEKTLTNGFEKKVKITVAGEPSAIQMLSLKK